MFEIRIICAPGDTDRVLTRLKDEFDVSAVRRRPCRDRDGQRLYLTADHRPESMSWPTPEDAYALAPSAHSEIEWTTKAVIGSGFGTFSPDVRDVWLRRAAALDRLALADDDRSFGDADRFALEAAYRLIHIDRTYGSFTGGPEGPYDHAVDAEPRGYVRQQYAMACGCVRAGRKCSCPRPSGHDR
ncbi:hypothetical protein [Streptomyces huiliensis]|uniref:hypothetical protein n=1 Tax=Streptomyces huiliensis TaxID=2876027 RepID=UPI001CBAD515|nr:hypothetical protein [Streptomyces huiliensis]